MGKGKALPAAPTCLFNQKSPSAYHRPCRCPTCLTTVSYSRIDGAGPLFMRSEETGDAHLAGPDENKVSELIHLPRPTHVRQWSPRSNQKTRSTMAWPRSSQGPCKPCPKKPKRLARENSKDVEAGVGVGMRQTSSVKGRTYSF